MLKISNFDVLPTENIYDYLLTFTETESFNQIFEDAGFEGANFIHLVGGLLIFLVVGSLFTLISYTRLYKTIKQTKIFRIFPEKEKVD